MRILFDQFVRSKSGLVFFMYLAFCAIVSAGVAYGFYHFSSERFRAHKAEEKVTALRLVDAFVTTYSSVRSQLGPNAPVPATFRAHSIESFNKKAGSNGEFLLRWVGRQGRQIMTPPADPEMARIIEAFAAKPDPKPVSVLSAIDGRLVFRTVYPSLAREQSCVNCHNDLQPDKSQWKLNDVMGAFAIDIPAASFLQGIGTQSYQVGLGLFMVLAAVGLAISILHFRQTSEREAAAAEVRTQNTRFDAALNNMSQGLSMFDSEQRLVVCNERYVKIYKLPPELVKPGTSLRQMLDYRCASGLSESGATEEYLSELSGVFENCTPWTKIRQLKDGRSIAVSFQPMTGGGWVATHEDVTEQRRNEARIAHLARHDILTNLPNRLLLRERLEQALGDKRHGDQVAVLCLDLDRFKEVNDTLGHPIGDALIKVVAERLRNCIPEQDTVARSGGDEYVILQLSDDAPKHAGALAARLIEVLVQPFELEGHQVNISTSIGIAVAPGDGTDPDSLLKHADLALYKAKAEGRATYRFFEQEMNRRMQARCSLERDLRNALAKGQLELNYQPIVNLASNMVTGCEALLRWTHPERGKVSPAEFIPIAEETGLILPIGEWVLRQACLEAATWPDPIKVAVNLSPVQFTSRGLVEMVFDALAASGLAADRLELEITESVLLQDSEATLATLHRLREFGVRIALDDFGTGYSSLSYLRSFPFHKIKIDRCFVNDLSKATPEPLAIVRAVTSLATALGMATTAEGVETEEQLDRIRTEGCTEMQGFLFSRPKPAKEIARLLRPATEHEATAA